MNRRDLVRALYMGFSLLLVGYVGVMLLHVGNKEEYLVASGVPREFVLYVYYGTIAACTILQILAAYTMCTAWLSSGLKRLLYTGLLLAGVLIALIVGLNRIYGLWVPVMAYAVPQILVIVGGWPRSHNQKLRAAGGPVIGGKEQP